MTEETRKITVEIPVSLHNELREHIQWGLQRHLVTAVLNLILEAVKSDGNVLMGAILDGDYKIVPRHKLRIDE